MDQNPSWKDAFRRVIPPAVLYEREVILRLGNTAGRLYAQMRFLDWLGFRRMNAGTASSSARNIVFVCFGNIMRSPMAEALLRDATASTGLTGLQISSAGLHAVPGKVAHPWALEAAEELGVSLANHRAKLITTDLVKSADAIFTMDFQNKAEMITRFPAAKHKILMLSSCAQGPEGSREIFDPYFGDLDATRRCFKVIRTCVLNLTSTLSAHDQKQSLESGVPR
jgi:protein-tyrosine-phosphatase